MARKSKEESIEVDASTPEVNGDEQVKTREELQDERIIKMVESVLEKTLVKVVPEVIIASQRVKTHQDAIQSRMSAEREQSKLQQCTCCRQRRIACGGVWRKASQSDIDSGVKVDKEGYILKVNENGKLDGGRAEFPEDNHVKMVVYPADPIAERFFPGVCLAGVWYRSASLDHKIWVPRNNDFAWITANYAKGEREQSVGKVHQHNSGDIRNFVPAGSDGSSFR